MEFIGEKKQKTESICIHDKRVRHQMLTFECILTALVGILKNTKKVTNKHYPRPDQYGVFYMCAIQLLYSARTILNTAFDFIKYDCFIAVDFNY